MAWTKKSVNGYLVASETVTLPSSATYGYTSEIDFIPQGLFQTKWVSMNCTASAVTGTNVDVSIVGHWTQGTAGSSMVTLLDAPVADVTNAAKTKSGTVDMKLYPMPYYRVALLADVDESANTMTVTIIVPQT